MKTIAIANQKGGVGKTATAVSLAAGLALRGKSVLLVDTDIQCSATNQLQAPPGEVSLKHLLFTGGRAADAIVTAPKEAVGDGIRIDVLPCTEKLFPSAPPPMRLKELLLPLGYDYCIIDTPPNIEASLPALVAADGVVVTSRASQSAVDGVEKLIINIEAISEKLGRALPVLAIVVAAYDPRSTISKMLLEDIGEIACCLNPVPVVQPIRYTKAVSESEYLHCTLLSCAPKSTAAADYLTLTDKLLEAAA